MSGLELAVVAGALSVASTVAGGYQQKQAGEAEKKALDVNAEILRRNAKQARMEGSINEDIERAKDRKELSQARSSIAEIGMESSATNTGVLAQEAANNESNALSQRYASETEANNYIANSRLAEYYGSQAQKRGKKAFYMSMISGVGDGLTAYMMGKGPENIKDVTGTARSGGNNVKFTNASYTGKI